MIDVIKEFAVSLTGLVDEKGLDKVNTAINDTSESLNAFATGAVALLTAGAFATAVRDVADRFNDLADTAIRMGNTTAEELDRLGYVADHTGSDAMVAASSLENLSKVIGEAANGVGKGASAFKDFGLSAKNSDGSIKSTTQVLEDLKGKIEGLSAAEQQAMIMRLGLDKTMIGMLTDDTSEIIAEYDKRTQALGLNVNEAGDMAADFNDNLGRMTRAFSDIQSAFIVRILPPLTEAIKGVTQWINDSASKIRKFIEPLTKAIDIAVRIVVGAMKGFSALIDLLGNIPAVLGLAGIAWKAFNTVVAMSPLGRFIALVTGVISAIGLLIDDFETFQQGGESFFKFWDKPWFKSVLLGINLVTGAIKGMVAMLEGIGELVLNILTGNFAEAFNQVASIVKNGLGIVGDLIKNGLKGVFGFGDDPNPDPKGPGFGESDLKIAPSSDVKPSVANSSVSNRTTSVTQTFNVRSREDASFISGKTMTRYAGGAA